MNVIDPVDGVFRIEVESFDGERARMWLDEETILRLAIAICDVCTSRKPQRLKEEIQVDFRGRFVAIQAGPETVLMCPGCATGLASAIVRACESRDRETATCHALN